MDSDQVTVRVKTEIIGTPLRMAPDQAQKRPLPGTAPPHTSKNMRKLYYCVLLVGVHSLALGAFIFFFTEPFYDFFFGVTVDNLFFVRQAGVFLFCLGLFYLVPLVNLEKHHRTVDIIILTKLLAVLFLVGNSQFVPRPSVILLAATGDAAMAILLVVLGLNCGILLKSSNKAPGK